jgi:outer membrane cobalamin receptor
VFLTAEEHYVAHQLLVKMNPRVYDLSYSAVMMTRGTRQTVRSNKLYGWLKKQFARDLSVFQKERFKDKCNHPCYGKFGKDHPAYGHKKTEQEKLNTGNRARGQTLSEECRLKMSKSMKIAFNTPEHKAKMSAIRKEAFKGEKNPAYGTKMINNGVVRKRIHKDQPVPSGWVIGAKFVTEY